jgi:O-antigen/teichoic acid export membrane protein
MTGPVSLLLNMTSYQKFLRNVSFFCLLISATTAYMLIPKWGINGVAFASLINIVLINLIGMGKVRKVFGFWSFYFPGVKVK